MRRREFIAMIGGAAAVRPLVTHAQQTATPVIGFLHSASPQTFAPFVAAFHKGLNDAGYEDGRNVAIEYRWALGQYNRMPALAADLVRLKVTVIAALGGDVSAQAAKAATSTIPVVFSVGGDPIREGLVAGLGRPGGNLTGVTVIATDLIVKQLELARELMPSVKSIAMLVNPRYPATASDVANARAAALGLGQEIRVFEVPEEGDLAAAFGEVARLRLPLILYQTEPSITNRRNQLGALAARYSIATVAGRREVVAAGGLLGYGASLTGSYRQVGRYVGRILGGAKPSDLPVMQPQQFETVVNVGVARSLGITIPQSILLRADEVIE
jgi:putative ABC transport system substrate-binding protein